MFPLILIGIIIGAAVRRAYGAGKAPPRTVVGSIPSLPPGRPSNRPEPPGVYGRALGAILKRGEATPSPRLIDLAMHEAWDRGDMRAIDFLSSLAAFQKPSEAPPPPESEPSKSQDQPPTVNMEPHVAKSPLVDSAGNHVPDDEWSEFVAAMKTKPVGYQDERYVGAYCQHRGRLRELGIEAIDSPRAQYDAFAADISDRYAHNQAAIAACVGDAVSIRGEDHAITLSGMLALLKAAGPKARRWLDSPADRVSFKGTTELFLKANGIF